MKRIFLALASVATLCAAGISSAAEPDAAATAAPAPGKRLTAAIVGSGGKKIGQAEITGAPTGALIRLEFVAGALTPGWHGAHIHEKADCSDAGFKISGSHVGHKASGKMHGLLNANPESGDLPNLFAPDGGPFGVEYFENAASLSSLLDADGFALIVHAGPDDYKTQPIGGAGARVACAAFKP